MTGAGAPTSPELPNARAKVLDKRSCLLTQVVDVGHAAQCAHVSAASPDAAFGQHFFSTGLVPQSEHCCWPQ